MTSQREQPGVVYQCGLDTFGWSNCGERIADAAVAKLNIYSRVLHQPSFPQAVLAWHASKTQTKPSQILTFQLCYLIITFFIKIYTLTQHFLV